MKILGLLGGLVLLVMVGCNSDSGTPAPIPPPPPTVPATYSYTATLIWDPVIPNATQAMIARYGVYRADMSAGYVKGSLYSWVTPDLVTFTDTFTSQDTSFVKYYVVTAIDVLGQESEFSNEVSKLFNP